MKKRTLLLLGISSLLLSCGNEEEYNQKEVTPQQEEKATELPTQSSEDSTSTTRSIALTDAQRGIMQKWQDFSFQFCRAMASSEELSNTGFSVSPVSLAFLLSMLNEGATGQTSDEICTLLGIDNDEKSAGNDLCRMLLGALPLTDSLASVQFAELLATEQTFPLSDSYRETLKEDYMAKVVSLPFHTKESVDFVNSWSKTHTNGNIPHLVDDFDGVMALANAVSFKAPWAGEFPKEETRNGVFCREDRSEVVMPLMHKRQAFCYTQYKDFAALGLPYGNGKHWTMFVLLPNEGKDVTCIVEWLSAETWEDCTQRMAADARTVDILLPRFRAEGDYELKGILSKMGVRSMFQSRNEFGLISSHSDGLCVGLLKQKTFMEVSEDGTEAAAVSVALQDSAVAPSEDNGLENITTFHATRPFIYLIQEDTSKAILFMGTFKG